MDFNSRLLKVVSATLVVSFSLTNTLSYSDTSFSNFQPSGHSSDFHLNPIKLVNYLSDAQVRSELRSRTEVRSEAPQYENKSGSRSTPPERIRVKRAELRTSDEFDWTERESLKTEIQKNASRAELRNVEVVIDQDYEVDPFDIDIGEEASLSIDGERVLIQKLSEFVSNNWQKLVSEKKTFLESERISINGLFGYYILRFDRADNPQEFTFYIYFSSNKNAVGGLSGGWPVLIAGKGRVASELRAPPSDLYIDHVLEEDGSLLVAAGFARPGTTRKNSLGTIGQHVLTAIRESLEKNGDAAVTNQTFSVKPGWTIDIIPNPAEKKIQFAVKNESGRVVYSGSVTPGTIPQTEHLRGYDYSVDPSEAISGRSELPSSFQPTTAQHLRPTDAKSELRANDPTFQIEIDQVLSRLVHEKAKGVIAINTIEAVLSRQISRFNKLPTDRRREEIKSAVDRFSQYPGNASFSLVEVSLQGMESSGLYRIIYRSELREHLANEVLASLQRVNQSDVKITSELSKDGTHDRIILQGKDYSLWLDVPSKKRRSDEIFVTLFDRSSGPTLSLRYIFDSNSFYIENLVENSFPGITDHFKWEGNAAQSIGIFLLPLHGQYVPRIMVNDDLYAAWIASQTFRQLYKKAPSFSSLIVSASQVSYSDQTQQKSELRTDQQGGKERATSASLVELAGIGAPTKVKPTRSFFKRISRWLRRHKWLMIGVTAVFSMASIAVAIDQYRNISNPVQRAERVMRNATGVQLNYTFPHITFSDPTGRVLGNKYIQQELADALHFIERNTRSLEPFEFFAISAKVAEPTSKPANKTEAPSYTVMLVTQDSNSDNSRILAQTSVEMKEETLLKDAEAVQGLVLGNRLADYHRVKYLKPTLYFGGAAIAATVGLGLVLILLTVGRRPSGYATAPRLIPGAKELAKIRDAREIRSELRRIEAFDGLAVLGLIGSIVLARDNPIWIWVGLGAAGILVARHYLPLNDRLLTFMERQYWKAHSSLKKTDSKNDRDRRSELRSLETVGMVAATAVGAWFFFRWADRGERRNRMSKEARMLGEKTRIQFDFLLTHHIKFIKNGEEILRAVDDRLKGAQFKLFVEKMYDVFKNLKPEFLDAIPFRGVNDVIDAVINDPSGQFKIDFQFARDDEMEDPYYQFIIVPRSELRNTVPVDPRRPRRVLIVNNELPLYTQYQRAIGTFFFPDQTLLPKDKILVAGSTEDAMRLATIHDDFDLILLDNELDGERQGVDILPDLRKRFPSALIVFNSANVGARTKAMETIAANVIYRYKRPLLEPSDIAGFLMHIDERHGPNGLQPVANEGQSGPRSELRTNSLSHMAPHLFWAAPLAAFIIASLLLLKSYKFRRTFEISPGRSLTVESYLLGMFRSRYQYRFAMDPDKPDELVISESDATGFFRVIAYKPINGREIDRDPKAMERLVNRMYVEHPNLIHVRPTLFYTLKFHQASDRSELRTDKESIQTERESSPKVRAELRQTDWSGTAQHLRPTDVKSELRNETKELLPSINVKHPTPYETVLVLGGQEYVIKTAALGASLLREFGFKAWASNLGYSGESRKYDWIFIDLGLGEPRTIKVYYPVPKAVSEQKQEVSAKSELRLTSQSSATQHLRPNDAKSELREAAAGGEKVSLPLLKIWAKHTRSNVWIRIIQGTTKENRVDILNGVNSYIDLLNSKTDEEIRAEASAVLRAEDLRAYINQFAGERLDQMSGPEQNHRLTRQARGMMIDLLAEIYAYRKINFVFKQPFSKLTADDSDFRSELRQTDWSGTASASRAFRSSSELRAKNSAIDMNPPDILSEQEIIAEMKLPENSQRIKRIARLIYNLDGFTTKSKIVALRRKIEDLLKAKEISSKAAEVYLQEVNAIQPVPKLKMTEPDSVKKKRSELRRTLNAMDALQPTVQNALRSVTSQSTASGKQIVASGNFESPHFHDQTILVLGPSVSTPDIIYIAAATGVSVMPLVDTQAQAAAINEHFATLGFSVHATTRPDIAFLRSELRKGARALALGLRDDSEILARLNRSIENQAEVRIADSLDAFGQFFGIDNFAARLRSDLREMWFTAVAA